MKRRIGITIGIVLTCVIVLLIFIFRSCRSSNSSADRNIVNYLDYSEKIESIEEKYLNSNGYVGENEVDELMNEVYEYADTLYQSDLLSDCEYNPVGGDTCIYMEINGWLGFVYDPPLKDAMSGTGSAEIFTFEPFSEDWEFAVSAMTMLTKRPDDAARLIEKEFPDFSFSHDYNYHNVNIEAVKNIEPNSIILWFGHGVYNETLWVGFKR